MYLPNYMVFFKYLEMKTNKICIALNLQFLRK